MGEATPPGGTERPSPWQSGWGCPPLALDDLEDWLLAETAGLEQRSLTTAVCRFIERPHDFVQPLPSTVLDLQRALSHPGTSGTKQLARVISGDALLTQRLLQLSADNAFGEEARSLEEIITRLGQRQLWEFAMRVYFMDRVYVGAVSTAQLRTLRGHLLEVAELASWLSRGWPQAERTEVYLAALLHDIGKFALWGLVSHAPHLSGFEVDALLDRLHAPLGFILCKASGLGERVQAAVAWHHHPAHAPEPLRPLAALLAAADVASHARTAGASGFSPHETVLLEQLHHQAGLDLDPVRLAAVLRDIRSVPAGATPPAGQPAVR